MDNNEIKLYKYTLLKIGGENNLIGTDFLVSKNLNQKLFNTWYEAIIRKNKHVTKDTEAEYTRCRKTVEKF